MWRLYAKPLYNSPGNLNSWTGRLRCSSCSRSLLVCVVLPDQSRPSITMNAPRFAICDYERMLSWADGGIGQRWIKLRLFSTDLQNKQLGYKTLRVLLLSYKCLSQTQESYRRRLTNLIFASWTHYRARWRCQHDETYRVRVVASFLAGYPSTSLLSAVPRLAMVFVDHVY